MNSVHCDDYDDTYVQEAVFKTTGAIVDRTSIDDEHTYWFLLGDWDETPTYDHEYAEEVLDMLNPDQSEKILEYLAENFVTLEESLFGSGVCDDDTRRDSLRESTGSGSITA